MPSRPEALIRDIEALGRWLRTAWGAWLARGIDRQAAAFHEWIEEGPCRADYRRLRVAARQTVAFGEMHRAGLGGAAEAVELGLDFLERHAKLPGGGFASRFGLDNRPQEAPLDTYDQGFVLLAYASAGVRPAELRPRALALLDWMDGALAHPEGGYREGIPDRLPRRQNPHMHLLEALHAAFGAFGDAVFLERAESLVALFLERMLDAETGALPEYFAAGWEPLRESGAFLVEPGHACEWVWLLHRHAALSGPDPRLARAAAGLMGFVDRAGGTPHGLANLLDSRGRVLDAGTRLWPQAERLKAELLRPDPDSARQAEAARHLAARLRPDGLWHERLDGAGGPVAGPVPATSLYHVTSAIRAAEAWAAGD